MASETSSTTPLPVSTSSKDLPAELRYIQYEHSLEKQYLPSIRALISKDLSEPYSIYALDPSLPLTPTTTPPLHGILIAKLETHSSHSPPTLRGYIAMLAVSSSFRGRGIATKLVKLAIDAMAARGADEIVLETEEGNVAAMRLYERLGFVRSKKLNRYYLNGSCAYRLVLHLKRVGDMTGMVEGREEDYI
ncbi:N-terminal acetyltransferase C complex catalytic subunit MAK3 [Botrytis cinerea]